MVPVRAERKAQGWSVLAMAKRLRDASDDPRDLPDLESICHNIHRWESGGSGVSERYRLLYCRVFGRTEFDLFGIGPSSITEPGGNGTAPTSALPPLPGTPAGTVMPEGADGNGFVLVVLPPGQHRITIEITGPSEDEKPGSTPEPEQARMLTVVKDQYPGQPETTRPPRMRRPCTGCGLPLSRYNPGNLCQACARAESRTLLDS